MLELISTDLVSRTKFISHALIRVFFCVLGSGPMLLVVIRGT
jgi:hypothetical protein